MITGGLMDSLGLAQLARWGLSEHDALGAGIFFTPSARALYTKMPDRPGLALPYYNPDGSMKQVLYEGQQTPFARIRLLGDDPNHHQRFTKAKPARYLQPAHTGVAAYFCKLIHDWPTILQDPRWPLIITEGEAKAAKGITSGFAVLALGGVFSFTTAGGAVIADLERITWAGRDTYICFDSDAATNPNVLAAEARLVDELQRKRGAKCRLVRLPPDGENKQGMDDFIIAQGAGAFAELLTESHSLGALDAKVLELNQHVAYIERENMVYDLHSKMFILKESFINGSKYSALKHVTVGAGQRAAPKEVSVAQTWLKHSHAARFDEILFRPSEGVTIRSESGRQALNMWSGFEPTRGDITPFLELTSHIFKNMRGDQRELPLKLMIYKAQNPAEKVPLSIMFVGPQGSGKSLWADCMMEAFAPYGVGLTPATLISEFQGWLETSLVAVINEVKGEDMKKGAEVLRSLISELKRPMNEKFRPARQINAYALYIITANDRSAGSFRADDRRMIVVNAPKPDLTGLYDRVGAWKHADGPRALMGWMLDFDLRGWKPPARAPLSAEKHLAHIESLTPVARLAEEMRTAGQNTVKLWLDAAVQWARAQEVTGQAQMVAIARATLDAITSFQIRPWYQPEELALMFPVIVSQLLGSRLHASTPSGQISRDLRDADIPYLENSDDPRGFLWRGRICQFLVVSDFDEWNAPISQANFERLMKQWPTYGRIARGAT